MFRSTTQRSQIKKINTRENQGNELITALGFGGLSTESYKPIILDLANKARIEAQSSSLVEAQELSYNLLSGFVQTLQETANKIEAKNNAAFDCELSKRPKKDLRFD